MSSSLGWAQNLGPSLSLCFVCVCCEFFFVSPSVTADPGSLFVHILEKNVLAYLWLVRAALNSRINNRQLNANIIYNVVSAVVCRFAYAREPTSPEGTTTRACVPDKRIGVRASNPSGIPSQPQLVTRSLSLRLDDGSRQAARM